MSNERYREAHLAYGYSRGIDPKARETMDMLQLALFDFGLSRRMFDMMVEELLSFFGVDTSLDDLDKAADGNDESDTLLPISFRNAKTLFQLYAVAIAISLIALRLEVMASQRTRKERHMSHFRKRVRFVWNNYN